MEKKNRTLITATEPKMKPYLKDSSRRKKSKIFRNIKTKLVTIWNELSDTGRSNLLKNKLDEEKVIMNPDREIKNLMKKFSLTDTNFYQSSRLGNRRRAFSLAPRSKKLINQLKNETSRALKLREMKISNAKRKINLVNEKLNKLRIIKQGNLMKNRNQSLRKPHRGEIYHEKQIEKKRKNYLTWVIMNELEQAELVEQQNMVKTNFLKKEILEREKRKFRKNRNLLRTRKQILMKNKRKKEKIEKNSSRVRKYPKLKNKLGSQGKTNLQLYVNSGSLSSQFEKADNNWKKRKRDSTEDDESIFEFSAIKDKNSTLVKYYGNYKKSMSFEKKKLKKNRNQRRHKSSMRNRTQDSSFKHEDYLTIFKFNTSQISECVKNDKTVKFPRYRNRKRNRRIIENNGLRFNRLNLSAGFKRETRPVPLTLLKGIFEEERI